MIRTADDWQPKHILYPFSIGCECSLNADIAEFIGTVWQTKQMNSIGVGH